MKKIFTYISLCCFISVIGQITHYNQFPTMQPQHILDENKGDISFAFSMRVLESDYNGPLIRLRRSSDNAEEDFTWGDNDIVDYNEIQSWGGTDTLYVVTWYDQSGLGRNAIQINTDRQPIFYNDSTLPYFLGDGVNDVLYIETGLQTLTNTGKNGTVLGVFYASRRADTAFGVANHHNRWLTHINWSNNNTYFDPGYCCIGGRNYNNSAGENVWDQYSFTRRDNGTNDLRVLRQGGIEKVNRSYSDSYQCTLDYNFGIGAVIIDNNNTPQSSCTTRFCEMIMYAEGKSDDFMSSIESNQINFWNI